MILFPIKIFPSIQGQNRQFFPKYLTIGKKKFENCSWIVSEIAIFGTFQLTSVRIS